jgi:hypothetical protein
MNNKLLAIAACILLSAATPALASEVPMNGQLPMYPHAKLDPKEASITPGAIAQGVPLVLLTDDTVHTVDAWYSAHVMKSCARQEASGSVKYACPGGSIMIYMHGQTQIALVPAFPKL